MQIEDGATNEEFVALKQTLIAYISTMSSCVMRTVYKIGEKLNVETGDMLPLSAMAGLDIGIIPPKKIERSGIVINVPAAPLGSVCRPGWVLLPEEELFKLMDTAGKRKKKKKKKTKKKRETKESVSDKKVKKKRPSTSSHQVGKETTGSEKNKKRTPKETVNGTLDKTANGTQDKTVNGTQDKTVNGTQDKTVKETSLKRENCDPPAAASKKRRKKQLTPEVIDLTLVESVEISTETTGDELDASDFQSSDLNDDNSTSNESVHEESRAVSDEDLPPYLESGSDNSEDAAKTRKVIEDVYANLGGVLIKNDFSPDENGIDDEAPKAVSNEQKKTQNSARPNTRIKKACAVLMGKEKATYVRSNDEMTSSLEDFFRPEGTALEQAAEPVTSTTRCTVRLTKISRSKTDGPKRSSPTRKQKK